MERKGNNIAEDTFLYWLEVERYMAQFKEGNFENYDECLKVLRHELKQKQLEEQVKERYFRVGVAAAELMVPLIFYGIWMRKGFKFEETGTYTSKTFTGLINRFKPTKK